MSAKTPEYGEARAVPRRFLEKILSSKTELMVYRLRYTQTEHLRTQSKLRDLVLNGKKKAFILLSSGWAIRLANKQKTAFFLMYP